MRVGVRARRVHGGSPGLFGRRTDNAGFCRLAFLLFFAISLAEHGGSALPPLYCQERRADDDQGVRTSASEPTVVSSGMIAALILLTYRNAWRLGRWVGQGWMAIVFRLSAFIALCIGVQDVWNGAMG